MVDKFWSPINENEFEPRDQIAYLPYSAFDSSRIATYAVSVFLIVYGSFRSLNLDTQHASAFDKSRPHMPQWCHWHILGSWQAALMPLAASISLLIMFLYFENLQLIFVIATCILATAAFAFLLLPLCQILLEPCASTRNGGNSMLCLGRYHLSEVASAIGGAALVTMWLITGHWFLMDLLAMGLCVAFIALVRLPSLKVSTLLLVGLLIYDIFWVFFSTYLFQTNVMVRVATRTVDSPLAVLVGYQPSSTISPPPFEEEYKFSLRPVGYSRIPTRRTLFQSLKQRQVMGHPSTTIVGSSTKLSLPGKLVFPSWQSGRYTMLGLGDIVVPGLLLCFVLRYDAFKRKQQLLNSGNSPGLKDIAIRYPTSATYIGIPRWTYFRCSLIGYFFGLITATICSEIFRSAQPALLYLVPFTMIPLFLMSYMRGDFLIMWNFGGAHTSGTQIFLKPAIASPVLLMPANDETCLSVPLLHGVSDISPPSAFEKPPPYTPSSRPPIQIADNLT